LSLWNYIKGGENKKVKKGTTRRYTTLKLTVEDKLYSEYIRKRAILVDGGCQRCGAKKYDILKDNGDVLTTTGDVV